MSDTHTPFDLSNLQVLVVEDNKYMQLLLQNVLRMFKIRRIMTADDGVQALDVMRTFQPDIIFCDWNMEGVDGIELTRKVRNGTESANPYVPIVMLTGRTEARHIFKARDAGVTEYLAKPLSVAVLAQRLTTVIENARPFIRTNDFFGPDRRRRAVPPDDAPRRRADDMEFDEFDSEFAA